MTGFCPPASSHSSCNSHNLHKYPKSPENTRVLISCYPYLLKLKVSSVSFHTNTWPYLESGWIFRKKFQPCKPAALEPMKWWHQKPVGGAALGMTSRSNKHISLWWTPDQGFQKRQSKCTPDIVQNLFLLTLQDSNHVTSSDEEQVWSTNPLSQENKHQSSRAGFWQREREKCGGKARNLVLFLLFLTTVWVSHDNLFTSAGPAACYLYATCFTFSKVVYKVDSIIYRENPVITKP